MAYTYEDFLNAAASGGVDLNTWSEQDRKTAEEHPEFGLALMGLGQDWNNATTEEAKVLAHAAAEQLRQSYGGYSGGANGAGYTPGGGSFGYDPEKDPIFQTYKKNYLREGDRASKEVLGQTAAMTGGIPSSYAETAAQQQNNYYAAKLADKIPELYQDAYSRAWNEKQLEYNREQNDKSTAQTMALAIIQKGGTPSAELLQQAGIDAEDAKTLIGLYAGATGTDTGAPVPVPDAPVPVPAANQYDSWAAEVASSLNNYTAQQWIDRLTQAGANGELTEAEVNTLYAEVINGMNGGVAPSKVNKIQNMIGIPMTGCWDSVTQQAFAGFTGNTSITTAADAWDWYLQFNNGGQGNTNIPQ